ncbi:hypothetical protein BSIN_2919 [Burkholderia singularis]|uniref:Uncharacterized protein n=1 Tax=Burkholderia singularis TaxID=1503053 RepID=A0A238H3W9_9BURK|nr:hypothetical protein BSIN_2919 [Burkholderia singularis]
MTAPVFHFGAHAIPSGVSRRSGAVDADQLIQTGRQIVS